MLILASKSAARRMMLKNAGILFTPREPEFDETAAKLNYPEATPRKIAAEFAVGKAFSVAKLHRNDFVIGSDQTLECDGVGFSKPQSIDEARQHLQSLKGRDHQLHSAVVLTQDHKIIWSTCETVTLTMRHFSDEFLEEYLKAEVDEILHCVGAYRIEGPGLQLFERIEGSYHAVLGMPLLPLLQKLRDHGLIAT